MVVTNFCIPQTFNTIRCPSYKNLSVTLCFFESSGPKVFSSEQLGLLAHGHHAQLEMLLFPSLSIFLSVILKSNTGDQIHQILILVWTLPTKLHSQSLTLLSIFT